MTMGVSTKDNDAEADDCKDLKHDDHDDGSQADRDVMDAAAAYNRPSSNNFLLISSSPSLSPYHHHFKPVWTSRIKSHVFDKKTISAYLIQGQTACVHGFAFISAHFHMCIYIGYQRD